MGKVVIINRYILKLGGIETNVCHMIKFMLDHGVRVIWIRQRENAIGHSFEKILNDKRLEHIYVHNPNTQWFKHDKFDLDIDDDVIVLSFNPSSFAKSLSLCREFPNVKIIPFYYIPDTTGSQYFRERYFPDFLCAYLGGHLSGLYKKWDSYSLLRFFSPLQIKALEDAYKFKISKPENKLLGSFVECPEFDEKGTLTRADERKIRFNIITVGRFDFPHKGYILGLIRAYGRLKNKYENLSLTVIGYGPHEELVHQEINNLPEKARKDLTLVGETPPDEILNYYKNAHLNISVAGAVGQGALFSVISIPARNYCEGECEVYGLSYESKIVTSTEPGHLVDEDIIRVIEMSNEEYCQETKRIYDLFFTKPNPWYVFETASLCENRMTISYKDILLIGFIEYARKVLTVYHFVILKLFGRRGVTFSRVVEKGKCPLSIFISFVLLFCCGLALMILLIKNII